MSQIPDKIWLFRMLHWSNVEHVLIHGLCYRGHANADTKYVNIGHRQLIADRHLYTIPIEGAGELGEYVPFYFAGHSPMLYLIMNGFKGVQQISQEDIVFFVCNVDEIINRNLSFVFTDKNAKLDLANFYNDPSDLDKLNWEIIWSKKWNNDNDQLDRQDLKQAEFLVKHHVPLECIHSIVVKTNERKLHFEKLLKKLNLEIKVVIDKNCKLYY